MSKFTFYESHVLARNKTVSLFSKLTQVNFQHVNFAIKLKKNAIWFAEIEHEFKKT